MPRCKWCNDILSPQEIEDGSEDKCPWKNKLNGGIDIDNAFHFDVVELNGKKLNKNDSKTKNS